MFRNEHQYASPGTCRPDCPRAVAAVQHQELQVIQETHVSWLAAIRHGMALTPIRIRRSAFDNVKAKPAVRRAISPRMMTVFGVGVLSISTYCGYLYSSYRQAVAQSKTLQVPEDVSDRYNSTASGYDAEVDLGEKFMRLGARRKELVRMARGDVLEVSCGTGRNMDYYQLGERRGLDEQGHSEIQGCRSVTFVDLSPQMVEIAQKKFRKQYPDFFKAAFRAEDARELLPATSDPASSPRLSTETPHTQTEIRGWSFSRPHFDTVLETMGLCSTTDPVSLLRHLGSITEPQRGRILLLEHGRSHYNWLNKVLDNLAPAHAHRHGCWWNRDIGQIIEQSGLEVVEIKRYHLGTTWRAVLRPKAVS
jgi:methyltransferase OMS1, mitochondrial